MADRSYYHDYPQYIGIYKYRNNGKLIETEIFSKDSTYRGKDIYHYDSGKNFYKYHYLGSHPNYQYKWHFKFDRFGNLNELNIYIIDRRDSSDLLVHHIAASYDKMGNIISEEGFDCEGDKYNNAKYTYEYSASDQWGNWTIKKIKSLDKTINIVKREIEYYPKS